jgi:hypothetical protein
MWLKINNIFAPRRGRHSHAERGNEKQPSCHFDARINLEKSLAALIKISPIVEMTKVKIVKASRVRPTHLCVNVDKLYVTLFLHRKHNTTY